MGNILMPILMVFDIILKIIVVTLGRIFHWSANILFPVAMLAALYGLFNTTQEAFEVSLYAAVFMVVLTALQFLKVRGRLPFHWALADMISFRNGVVDNGGRILLFIMSVMFAVGMLTALFGLPVMTALIDARGSDTLATTVISPEFISSTLANPDWLASVLLSPEWWGNTLQKIFNIPWWQTDGWPFLRHQLWAHLLLLDEILGFSEFIHWTFVALGPFAALLTRVPFILNIASKAAAIGLLQGTIRKLVESFQGAKHSLPTADTRAGTGMEVQGKFTGERAERTELLVNMAILEPATAYDGLERALRESQITDAAYQRLLKLMHEERAWMDRKLFGVVNGEAQAMIATLDFTELPDTSLYARRKRLLDEMARVTGEYEDRKLALNHEIDAKLAEIETFHQREEDIPMWKKLWEGVRYFNLDRFRKVRLLKGEIRGIKQQLDNLKVEYDGRVYWQGLALKAVFIGYIFKSVRDMPIAEVGYYQKLSAAFIKLEKEETIPLMRQLWGINASMRARLALNGVYLPSRHGVLYMLVSRGVDYLKELVEQGREKLVLMREDQKARRRAAKNLGHVQERAIQQQLIEALNRHATALEALPRGGNT